MTTRDATASTIVDWLNDRRSRFNAPYGILQRDRGKYIAIVFGVAGILDAEVRVYASNWLLLRSSISGNHVFRSLDDLLRDMTARFA